MTPPTPDTRTDTERLHSECCYVCASYPGERDQNCRHACHYVERRITDRRASSQEVEALRERVAELEGALKELVSAYFAMFQPGEGGTANRLQDALDKGADLSNYEGPR